MGIIDLGGYGSSAGQSSANGYSMGATHGAEASAFSALQAQAQMEYQNNMWEKTSKFNAKEAQKQRDWQEHMAATAYQRTVADLMAAGLNPILAVSNGANTAGSGASASTSAQSGAMGQTIADSESMSANSAYSWNAAMNDTYMGAALAEGLDTFLSAAKDLMNGDSTGFEYIQHMAGTAVKEIGKVIAKQVQDAGKWGLDKLGITEDKAKASKEAAMRKKGILP